MMVLETGSVVSEKTIGMSESILCLKEKLLGDMQEFCDACDELVVIDNDEAFDMLLPWIDTKDRYRKLYAFKSLAKMSRAVELAKQIETALKSDDDLFAIAALRALAEKAIPICETLLKRRVEHYLDSGYNECEALMRLTVNTENYNYLVNMFCKAKTCMTKEIISDLLCDKYMPEHAMELFELFASSSYGKLRCKAVDIGLQRGFDLDRLKNDSDGHVRAKIRLTSSLISPNTV